MKSHSDFDDLVEALRSDLPSKRDSARLRAKLSAIGIAASAGLSGSAAVAGLTVASKGGAAAAATAAGEMAAHITGWSLVAKVSVIAAVSVSAAAGPAWYLSSRVATLPSAPTHVARQSDQGRKAKDLPARHTRSQPGRVPSSEVAGVGERDFSEWDSEPAATSFPPGAAEAAELPGDRGPSALPANGQPVQGNAAVDGLPSPQRRGSERGLAETTTADSTWPVPGATAMLQAAPAVSAGVGGAAEPLARAARAAAPGAWVVEGSPAWPSGSPVVASGGAPTDSTNGFATRDAVPRALQSPIMDNTSGSAGLREENLLIDRALSAIRAQDLAAAASALSEHERRFPMGLLCRERARAQRRLDELQRHETLP